jgi:hypothetical protein
VYTKRSFKTNMSFCKRVIGDDQKNFTVEWYITAEKICTSLTSDPVPPANMAELLPMSEFLQYV